ncbi:hypothetical protein [Asticcacaulis sp. EMRT-3]|uniref:hypothetical protein n=1 Tax=Asticcacaulis sp. EMRT-3 TaxID=3040349 RepID=UPI0024AEA919|nr:hypothetical protein [Asticcacaulis sp. EMRT-3]MDI7776399.1 hypothetical protein [Asticcacaulis sp. EMRT-3]
MDANPTHDEAISPAPTGRDRLRALAGDLLDIMETLDKPKTYLEVERAARAVMVMDRLMTQLDQAPRPIPSRAASRSSGRFDDFDDDSYVSPYGGWRENKTEQEDEAAEGEDAQNCKDWAAIIEMKLNRLAKAKGYPPYGPGPQEPQLDDDDPDPDPDGDPTDPP